MTGKNSEGGGGRVWPGIIAPLGLTILLGVAAFLFVSKVSTDQERAEARALELERYARTEAGRMAAKASAAVGSFSRERASARQSLEKNLRLEAQGVLDAVVRLLGVALEKAGKGAAGRREVGPLPPEFDAMRVFLEMPPAGERIDGALAALRATAPELGELLPSGSRLTVVEDYSRELLSLGGAPAEDTLSAAMHRDFIFNDGSENRNWSLRVEVASPDSQPLPTPEQMAARVTEELGDRRLGGVAWRGWLLWPAGGVAAVFPASGVSGDAGDPPPFIEKTGEWVVIDDNRLAWLERGAALPEVDLTPAVAVAIARPPPPLILANEFWRDWRWCATLSALALLSLVAWIWFARSVLRGGRAEVSVPARRRERPTSLPDRPRQRLVRDDTAERAIPEVQGVIVADIGEDGRVRLHQALAPPPPPRPAKMPSGSLERLQAMHRGGRKGARGSRVLEQARSQLLRDLAAKVRPPAGDDGVAERQAHAIARARATDRIAVMKSATGWRKVGDEED